MNPKGSPRSWGRRPLALFELGSPSTTPSRVTAHACSREVPPAPSPQARELRRRPLLRHASQPTRSSREVPPAPPPRSARFGLCGLVLELSTLRVSVIAHEGPRSHAPTRAAPKLATRHVRWPHRLAQLGFATCALMNASAAGKRVADRAARSAPAGRRPRAGSSSRRRSRPTPDTASSRGRAPSATCAASVLRARAHARRERIGVGDDVVHEAVALGGRAP